MRTDVSHVTGDERTEASTGNPVTESLTAEPPTAESLTTGPVPAARTPNVRVPPAAGHGRKAAGAGDAWCADGTGNDGPAPDAVETRDTVVSQDTVVSPDTVRRPGRPRSERAEQAIIDAAIEALGEHGIDGVRCEDVAARAGVGKATLYRRWAGKEDLLIAAFAAMKHPLPEPRGESVREDLVALLAVIAADADDPRYAQQYALLHGAGERYPRLVARYREQVVEPRRDLVRAVLRRGVQTGELRPGIDVEVAMLLLTGAVLARGKHDPTPAEPGFVESAVDELLLGITPR
jgi:AcrR family transcriptional regulator